MLAFQLSNGQQRLVADYPIPTPQPHEVLVKVTQAGICETDLQLINGYMSFSGILGHEFVGVPESGVHAGRRVVGEINCCPVEKCAACPTNRHHCSSRSVLGIFQRDGAFAEYVAVPEENLHPLPDNLDSDRAVFVEPLAAAFQILEQISLKPSDRVIVLGDGRLGYLIAQALAQTGADIVVVGKHSTKLERFAARGFATMQLADLPNSWIADRNADVVVDCTGHPSGIELAVQLVRPRGTIVLKTTVANAQKLSLAPIVIDEIRLIGSRCGPFDVAIEALATDRIEVRSLITSRFGLPQIEQALEVAQQANQHKVLIDL